MFSQETRSGFALPVLGLAVPTHRTPRKEAGGGVILLRGPHGKAGVFSSTSPGTVDGEGADPQGTPWASGHGSRLAVIGPLCLSVECIR